MVVHPEERRLEKEEQDMHIKKMQHMISEKLREREREKLLIIVLLDVEQLTKL